ncbi:hypothetical protein [Patulibacter minatonensis]|uniref:hypothetical protein n=1 Tax=Patulibacter minatonensis TaxID=298163 RepID=UPI00047BAA77|nr:hypothetical protein [Patulibacter minatonensis]
MIGFRPIAVAGLLVATLGLSACGGGDDDEDSKASDQSAALQKQGVKKEDADQLAAAATQASEKLGADGSAQLKKDVAAQQKKATDLQAQLVKIAEDVKAKRITNAEGNERIGVVRIQIQEAALAVADELDKAGALPAGAKQQVETARRQLEKDKAAQAK